MEGASERRKYRTVTVSFRLPKEMIGELAEESERVGSSPSATLRQVLEKHLNWDRYRIQTNMICIPSAFVNESLSRLSRKEIENVASQSANAFNGLILLKTRRVDFVGALQVIEEWLRDSSIKYRRGYADGWHVFVVQHDLELNWSFYLACFFTSVFGNINNIQCKVELNRNGKNVVFFVRANLQS